MLNVTAKAAPVALARCHAPSPLQTAPTRVLRAAEDERARRESIACRAAYAGVRRAMLRANDSPHPDQVARHFVDALVILGAPRLGSAFPAELAHVLNALGNAGLTRKRAFSERVMFHAMSLWAARGAS